MVELDSLENSAVLLRLPWRKITLYNQSALVYNVLRNGVIGRVLVYEDGGLDPD